MEWIEKANEDNNFQTEILSFQDYMDRFEKNPRQECRPTCIYLKDMLEHHGKDESGHFKLFQEKHPDNPSIFGQYKPQQSLYQNISNFQEEGFNNKFILLVGPNGSAKSSIVKKMMKGAELYSETDEGALFSFSWIFPIENIVKGPLGLGTNSYEKDFQSFAYLDDKDVSAILPSDLKDHPLLLIPLKYRRKLIDETFKDDKPFLDVIHKSYLYKGNLTKRNRMIFDALLKNYKGDFKEVLKHIRVERFTISRRYSNSAVTIEPQMHVDARMQQITMDKRLASLPPSLQSLNLFSMQGEIMMANRGILEYSDLLKRPLDSYKYLLMTMETADLNISGILTELDIFFVGTSNEIHLAAFKQHPDFNSFKGRFNFIRVPYLLNFREEEKIYQEQVDGLKEHSVFEPHSLEVLSLFAIMTRIRSSQSKNYANKKLSTIVTQLSPLEKALILCDESLPDRLDMESKQILKHGISEIVSEFETENLYEGKFGLSPRDLKNIIYELASENGNVTFLEVLDYLGKLVLRKNDFDFLNMTPQGDYHNPIRFLTLLKNFSLDEFDRELRESLGLVDNRSYEEYIRKYIENIKALIKGEKIKNTITGQFEDCDEYFIKEFETNIDLKEDPSTYRGQLLGKLGAYALDNPDKDIIYSEVFPNLIERLQESFRTEQKSVIQNISKGLVYFEAEQDPKKEGKAKTKALSEKERGIIETILTNLEKKFQYSQRAAISILKYVIKERY